MEAVSARHEGNLHGTLRPFDPRQAVSVQVVVDESVASAPAVQHTAWMLVNLLARAEGIVSRIDVLAPDTVVVHDRTIPFGADERLAHRLVEGGSLIGVVPVTADSGGPYDRTIVVGRAHPARPLNGDDLVAIGAGWWGGVALGAANVQREWEHISVDRHEPIGPYIAATLSAADVFLRVRDPRAAATTSFTHGWDAWRGVPVAAPSDLGPPVSGIQLDSVGLAGVGAVGAAWMHTIWACRGVSGRVLAVDADQKGVSRSNLNRGLLFRREDVDAEKASTAAAATPGDVSWVPHQGRFEAQTERPALLISAVDANTARDALQALYPAQTLSASTQDLRVEVTVGGEPGIGACLRCFNRPETRTSDDELRAHALGHEADVLGEIAAAIGTDVDDVRRRLSVPGCDAVTDRLLAQLRRRYGDDVAPARFAVGFVSAMAGVLLASETVRLHLDPASRPAGAALRTTFQFHRPDSPVNGCHRYARDHSCPKCAPEIPAMRIWRSRHKEWRDTAGA